MPLMYPDPDLADDLVRMRRWSDGDLDCVREAATDPGIPRGTTVPAVFTPEAGRAFVRRQWGRVETDEGVSLALAEAATDEALGLAVLVRRPQPGVVGIGYWVIPRARGRGLATSAVRLLSSWALAAAAMARVEAWVEPANVGSQRVLTSAGFTREGVLRSFFASEDGRADAVVFSRIPQPPRRLPSAGWSARWKWSQGAARGAGGMGQVVRFAAPGHVALVEEPERAPEADEVRIRTRYSGISAGTELTAYRGSNPYLSRRWDPERRLFVIGDASYAYPLDGWGYEEVGRVVEVGRAVDPALRGRMVWGTWGHRAAHVAPAAYAAARLLPAGFDPLMGIFARIGAIALNGLHDAEVNLGETVAVFGLGVPGLLVTQLCLLSGVQVLAVDGIEDRLALARRFGAAEAIDHRAGDPAERIRALTQGRGVDTAIEVSGSHAALQQAIRSTAYNSRVVCVGFLQGEGAALRLGEEFHHNRIQLISSQTSGVSARIAHRWDRERLERTVMDLIAGGRLDVGSLVTHVLPVAEAGAAFALLDRGGEGALQVVLDFGDDG